MVSYYINSVSLLTLFAFVLATIGLSPLAHPFASAADAAFVRSPAFRGNVTGTTSSSSSSSFSSSGGTVPRSGLQPVQQQRRSFYEDEKLTAEEIKLPDHLEGVKIERDGRLNKNFRNEVILGRKDGNLDIKKNPDKLITRIFRRADKNKDRDLTIEELSEWITSKVNEHLDKAIKDNFHIFMTIDKDHNGLVTWDEYHTRYLLEQGFNNKYVENHSEKHKDMTRQMREEILLDRAAFFEAARTNDEGLNIDEFLSFRHPEHSHATLLNMVQDIFDKLDDNGDDALTLKEFVSLKQDDVANNGPKMSEEMWMKERRREFEQVIDADKNGKVTRQELVMYSDPKNPSHALMEAKSLMEVADTNKDGKLSLAEVLAHRDLFLGSKMVDIAKKFHDEF